MSSYCAWARLYRARNLEKMNIATNADIIRYALHNHLVD